MGGALTVAAAPRLAREALLANIPDVAFMLDADGRFVAVNDEFLRVTELRPDEIVGRTEFDLFPPAVATQHHADNLRVLATGQRVTVEEEIPLRDGASIWCETIKTPFHDEHGRPAGIVGIARNVTERRRAVDALRQSEAWFRALSEKASDMIAVADARGCIIYESPSNSAVLGYEPEELLGRSLFDRVHPDERVQAEAMFAGLLAEPSESISARIRYQHKSGSWRTLDLVARNLVNDPAVAGIVLNYRDVTEQELAKAARRDAEQQAREMAERMHTVARAAADVVDADSVAALQEVAYRACQSVIPLDVFTFGLYDRAAHALRFRQNSWSGAEHVDVLPLAGRPAERVVRERRSLLTLRADTAAGDDHRPESVIRTPIVAGDEVLGVMSVQSFTPDRYARQDVELLEAVAALAATALKKIRLIDELRESEERFRSITEAAGDAIVSADADGNVLTWNPAAERTFGYTAAEIVGRPMTTIMPERTQDAASVRVEDGESAGRTIELDALRSDGVVVPVELSLSVWETAGERQFGAIMRDVTERRRAEVSLRESEERYAMAARATSEVIWDWDIASGRIDAMGAWAQTFGFAELPEVTFDWFVDRVHPDDVERVRSGIEAVLLGGGQMWSDEFRIRRADGTYAAVLDRGYVIRDAAGRPVRMVGSLADVTARREAEDRVRHSERLLARSQQIAHAGSWELDLGTGRLSWSDELWRIFGHEPGAFETSYERFEALLHPDDRAPIAAVMQRLTSGGAPAQAAEYRIVRPDGSVRVLAGRAEVVTDAGAPRVIGTAQDVTEAKAAERELRAAKETAEAASLAKSEFLANMSHEIRTPMNGVLGMVDLALESPLTPEQRDYLTVARGSAGSLLGVIDDILDFSKIEAGKLDLDASPFQLGEGLGGVVRVLCPRAQSKGLALTAQTAGDVPDCLVGDVGRLRQVLINLVGNAIKFTERGAVEVRVDVAERGDREVTLHFAVSDTGIGIPRGKQAAIFEAFQQADTSTTRVYGGTGLGLTISARLVELMGGRIWVVSREGQGSTFHFTARFGVRIAGARSTAAARPNVEPAAAPAPALPALARGGRALRVLLAEDNAVNRKLAVTLLSRRGHTVVATTNGREALDAWEGARGGAERFDIVLMDVQMPEMDGFAATAAIREREGAGAHTPIVALTARAMKGDRERCLDAGMDAYVSKPISAPALFAAIDALVPAGAPAEASAEASAAAALPTEGVFDEGALLTFVEGSAELLRELAALFLEDAPRYVEEIRAAVRSGDAAALAAAAHTLKGAAGSMTARRVAEAARTLEAAARAADLAAAPAALATLEREMDYVRAALEPIAA